MDPSKKRKTTEESGHELAISKRLKSDELKLYNNGEVETGLAKVCIKLVHAVLIK